MFEFDGNDGALPNGTDLSGKHSKDDTIENQEIIHEDVLSNGTDVSRVGFADDLDVDTRSFETYMNVVVLNEDESGSGDENYADYERRDAIRYWGRRSIVDDLVDDIYDFETDSDNDDGSVSLDDTEKKGVPETADDISAYKIIPENDDVIWEEIPDLDQVQVKENAAKTHSGWKEWSIVNDLIEDVDTQLDELPDMDDGGYTDGHDSDEDGNELTKEISVNSRLSIMKLFQNEHSLWGISGEDMTHTFFVSLYTFAGIAASLIGISN